MRYFVKVRSITADILGSFCVYICLITVDVNTRNHMMVSWYGNGFPLLAFGGILPLSLPYTRPTMGSFRVSFAVSLDKQSSCWWLETPWRSCDITVTSDVYNVANWAYFFTLVYQSNHSNSFSDQTTSFPVIDETFQDIAAPRELIILYLLSVCFVMLPFCDFWNS